MFGSGTGLKGGGSRIVVESHAVGAAWDFPCSLSALGAERVLASD